MLEQGIRNKEQKQMVQIALEEARQTKIKEQQERVQSVRREREQSKKRAEDDFERKRNLDILQSRE